MAGDLIPQELLINSIQAGETKAVKLYLENDDNINFIKADIKFYFKCSLDVAAKRRFIELKKTNKNITFFEVKKAMRIRDNLDKKRKYSPLIQAKNAVIVRTDKLKNIKGMINKMSAIIEKRIKKKYGS